MTGPSERNTTWDEDDEFDQDSFGDSSGHSDWDHDECDSAWCWQELPTGGQP